jgi:hypothetical protein
LNQGASIEVLQGLRVDYVPNSPRPFEEFARKIGRIRKDAKSRGDQVLDRLAKEVGNSAYGKIAQAVASQRSIPDDVDTHSADPRINVVLLTGICWRCAEKSDTELLKRGTELTAKFLKRPRVWRALSIDGDHALSVQGLAVCR